MPRATSSGTFFSAVTRVGRQVLGVRPVVDHFVVVPLPDLRHFGVEAAHVLVEQVVAVAPPEFVQRLCDLGHLGCDDVGPDLASLSDDRLGDWAVGIDGVAAMDEEVRAALTHRFVDLHPAEGRVDPPTLTCRVPAPQKAQIAACMTPPAAFIDHALRRDDEPAGHRLADRTSVVQALERDTHEHVAARLQTCKVLPRGEVGGVQRMGPDEALHVLELLIVHHSTSMRAARSLRLHTTTEPLLGSPNCKPCSAFGRSLSDTMIAGAPLAKVHRGSMTPAAVATPACKNRRRATESIRS